MLQKYKLLSNFFLNNAYFFSYTTKVFCNNPWKLVVKSCKFCKHVHLKYILTEKIRSSFLTFVWALGSAKTFQKTKVQLHVFMIERAQT